jgi:hypothetical protein
MRASVPSPSAGRGVPVEPSGPSPERLSVSARQDIALTAMLVLLCALLFVATPLAALGFGGSRLLISLLILPFTLLVVLIARGRTAALVAWFGAGCVATGAALILTLPSLSLSSIDTVHSVNAIGLVVCGYVVARALFAPGPVTLHRVIGAVVLYLTLALAFATMYRVVLDAIPNALQGIELGGDEVQTFSSMVYFSLVTLTSTGYGDILPIHPVARSLANLESIVGQLYPATLIAALVTQRLDWRHHR